MEHPCLHYSPYYPCSLRTSNSAMTRTWQMPACLELLTPDSQDHPCHATAALQTWMTRDRRPLIKYLADRQDIEGLRQRWLVQQLEEDFPVCRHSHWTLVSMARGSSILSLDIRLHDLQSRNPRILILLLEQALTPPSQSYLQLHFIA